MLLGSYTKTCNLYLNWKNQHELKIFDSLKTKLLGTLKGLEKMTTQEE